MPDLDHDQDLFHDDPPVALAPDPEDLFELDASLPLAMFPVRLEARWLPDGNPTEIVVRIFPDEITVDRHHETVTDAEADLALAFWEATWRAAGTEPASGAARRWLAGHLGEHRAAWLARVTRPRNRKKAPTEPVETLDVEPDLAMPGRRTVDDPPTAALLPDAFVAWARKGSTTYGPFPAKYAVRRPLPVAPALTWLEDDDADAATFLKEQGLDWLTDLDVAEQAGLVIRIPVSDVPGWTPSGWLQDIVVLGIRRGKDFAGEVKELFEAHRASVGLEFIQPGTATNRESVDTSTAADADQALADRFAAEVADEKLPLRLVTPKEPLSERTAADAAALTFGLLGATAFDRTTDADSTRSLDARAMNAVLFPGTIGRWVQDPMAWHDTGAPFLSDIPALHDWYVRWIRPDGPLPTVLVGRQPYGILPISRFPRHADPNTPVELIQLWTAEARGLQGHAWDGIDVLDPDASDASPTSGSAAAAVSSTVGAVWSATPHLHQFWTREVTLDWLEEANLYRFRLGFAELLAASHDYLLEMFEAKRVRLSGVGGLEDQQEALDELVAQVENTAHGDPLARYLDPWYPVSPSAEDLPSADVTGMLSDWGARIQSIRPFVELAGAESRLDPNAHVPGLYYAAYGDESTDVEVFSDLPHDPAGAEALGRFLDSLDDLADEPFSSRKVPAMSDAAPLLTQLLHSGLATMWDDSVDVFKEGVAHLRTIVDTDPDHAVERIEWLAKAALGPASFRIDSWPTGIATAQLSDLRMKRRNGLQVGAYGWLCAMRERTGPASKGFIHAPTLDHATTAAVLRSGWLAFGTSDEGSPLAVDLSASRIRAAQAVIDGVRAGHDIGMVVGSRLERALFEQGLSHHVDSVRRAVGAAVTGEEASTAWQKAAGTDDEPGTAAAIVDGVVVARAMFEGIEHTKAEERARTNLDTLIAIDSDLQAVLEASSADLDGVADSMMAQAVHAVLRGDDAVAAPTMSAIGSGESGIPPLSFGQSHRRGTPLTHHVVGFLPADAAAWPADASVASIADPIADAWAERLLGKPSRWTIRFESSEGAQTEATLSDLRVAAIDVVAGSDDLAGVFRRAEGHDESVTVRIPDELTVLARLAHHLFGRIRPARPADLVESGAEAPVATTAVTTLEDRLDAVLGAMSSDDPRALAVADHVAAHADGWDGLDDEARDALLRERLTLAVGVRLPLFTANVSVPAALESAFGSAPPAPSAAIDAWLVQIGRVHEPVQTALDTIQVAEAVHDATLFTPAIAQAGGGADDQAPWIALHAPTDGSTTSWCSVTGPPNAGDIPFVVDTVVDTIPASTQPTGIAVHFDRPSAQAPHAVLIAAAPPGQGLKMDDVVGMVHETLDETWNRAVLADRHTRSGQAVPAIFFDDDAEFGTVEA